MDSDISKLNNDCIIQSERVFLHSQTDIFSAWSNPEILKEWWGPKGFTNTFEKFEFKNGGRWKFTMHGPDKGNYQNEVEFIDIQAPSLIYWKRLTQPFFEILATFEKISEQETNLIFRMIFPSVEACEKMKKYVVDKNEENFDKLESVLKNVPQK